MRDGGLRALYGAESTRPGQKFSTDYSLLGANENYRRVQAPDAGKARRVG